MGDFSESAVQSQLSSQRAAHNSNMLSKLCVALLFVGVAQCAPEAEADAVASPDADAAAHYYGGYYGGYYRPWGYSYGYHPYGYWGRKKRDAEAEPTAVADAVASPDADANAAAHYYGSYYGYPYRTHSGTTAMDTGAGRRGRRRPPPRLTPMPTPRLTLTRGTVATTDTLDMDIGMVTTGPTDTTGVKFYDISST